MGLLNWSFEGLSGSGSGLIGWSLKIMEVGGLMSFARICLG